MVRMALIKMDDFKNLFGQELSILDDYCKNGWLFNSFHFLNVVLENDQEHVYWILPLFQIFLFYVNQIAKVDYLKN